MSAFYNENDAYVARWLRNLIDAGHIAPGVVDERDIRDITPADLDGYSQCHFFAGIGVWSLALRRAGWPDDKPVWTGSCPCQPFSAAGRRGREDDERHLWPHWHFLIEQRRPAILLGEQVASKDGLGWLDLVSADLESAGYAFAASDLCAAGFGGAHIRQRLYFAGVADTHDPRLEGWQRVSERAGERLAGQGGLGGGVGDSPDQPRERDTGAVSGTQGGEHGTGFGVDGGVPVGPCDAGEGVGGMADNDDQGCDRVEAARLCERRDGAEGDEPTQSSSDGSRGNDVDGCGADDRPHAPMFGRHAADWLYCRDGKWRPVEPGSFPLAVKAPARVGRLRAYGNSLDADTAQGFIESVIEAIDDAATMTDAAPVRKHQLDLLGALK